MGPNLFNLTESAVAALEEAVDPTDFVRIGVRTGGCSGNSYVLEIAEEKDKNDIILQFGSISVCMDPASHFMLSETIVDYVETFTSSGFKFLNPKAERTCGCGESFSSGEAPCGQSS